MAGRRVEKSFLWRIKIGFFFQPGGGFAVIHLYATFRNIRKLGILTKEYQLLLTGSRN
jgi:hypothetical protein